MTKEITIESSVTLRDDVITISRSRLDEIQEWLQSCDFDEDDMTDISREKTFGEYTVTREHFQSATDDVGIQSGDSYVTLLLPDILEF